jgi:hypothetical protein
MSYVPSAGVSTHVPGECRCVRCAGFQPGNRYGELGGRPSVHGAKAREHVIARSERTREFARSIRAVVPAYDEADAFAVEALAVVLVRIERAEAALAQVEAETDDPTALYRGRGAKWVDNLRKDLRSWLSVAERYFGSLGMSPGSRARLGLDIARARQLTIAEWHAQAAIEADEEVVVE